MVSKYDPNAYANLLVEYLPGVIQTEAENEKALAIVLQLMKKGERGRSPEESRLLELLVTLVEDFEEKAYPLGSSNPAVALRELMNEHELKQTDMVEIFGSQGTVSLVLNGKREISKSQARKLSERFRLPIDIFIGFFFVLISLTLVHQADAQVEGGFQDAKLLKSPKVTAPKEAKETNVSGKVVVRVTVDESGKVVSVDDVLGPGAVCRSVERPDVVAIRNSARVAAMEAKFSPALANNSPLISSTTIEFDFPVKPDNQKGANLSTYKVVGTSDDPSDSKELSGGVLNGKALTLPKPVYPRAARTVNASGTVKVLVLILEDGTIFSAEATSGHPLLRAPAVIAACGAKFTPTNLEGKPVKVSGYISYNFVSP